METAIQLTSFGYGHAPAPYATITIDTRDLLRDPHVEPALRILTGRHALVRQRVLSTAGSGQLIADVTDLAADLLDATGHSLHVAIGCVGGRHRSVVLVDQVAAEIRRRGVRVEVRHRDVDRAVLPGRRHAT